MKILVTGGAGFIGSHVADAFIKAGHGVVVLDNLSGGFRRNINPHARFVKLDIRDHKRVNALLKKERFDVIDHHAAQMDVRKSVLDPMFDAETNILASINLIKTAVETRVKKFIYISTGGAVYGEPKRLPVMEDDPVNPECQYGISKHTVEHYLYLYGLNDGLGYTVLRYPNVYGPRQNPHGEAGVIAIFGGLMLAGKTPMVFGFGKPTRDYVFVGDVAQANVRALRRGDGEIINLGSEKGTSVLQLYRHLQRILNFPHKPKLAPLRKGEINRIYLTGAKARKLLGWSAKTSVADGLQKTMDWLRAQKK